MPNYNDYFGSTLKGEDLQDKGDVRVVIEEVTLDDIKGDHGNEQKLVVHFMKAKKGLVLNRINGDTIAQLAGTPLTENWGGTVVVLYYDPDIMFGAKKVGGIRVKAPGKAAPARPVPVQATKPAPEPITITEDDIPF